MKTSLVIVLSFLVIPFLFVPNNTYAQYVSNIKYTTSVAAVSKINGDDLIEKLSSRRFEFTRNLTKSNSNLAFPQAESIFNRAHETIITFNGMEFLVKDNEVIAIKGLNLSEEVLAQITEKLVFLDRVQFYYSEKSNMTYLSPNSDIQEVKFLDKQFISSLKIFNTTLKDIASFTKAENPSLSVEMNVSKMREPNIDKSIEKQTLQSFVKLAK